VLTPSGDATTPLASRGNPRYKRLMRTPLLVVMLLLPAHSLTAAVLECIQPDSKTGSSRAVIVEDVPLVHTMQVFPVNARGRLVTSNQPEQVLANLETILRASGAGLDIVCKLNVYVTGPNALTDVQAALARTLSGPIKPAISYVTTALPVTGATVAMDAVAPVTGSAGPPPAISPIRNIFVEPGILPASILQRGPKIFVSGMADTNKLADATRKTLEKLTAAISHLGLQKTDIVQLKAFLEPMSEVDTARKEIAKFFDGNAPPVSFVEWISPPPNPCIEIELVASAYGDFSKETNSVTFLTPPGTTDSKVFRRVARVNYGKLIYTSGLYGKASSDAATQVTEIFQILDEIVKQTGSDFQHLAKATYYVSDDPASNKLNELRPKYFNPDRPPAASKAKVMGVGLPDGTMTMDMIAVPK
jgi:enamine deaminase RidA (YjgF/YER057c/UK114 family)